MKKNYSFIWIPYVFLLLYTKFHSAILPGSARNELMKITLLEKKSEIYMPNRGVFKVQENIAKSLTINTGNPALYIRRTLFTHNALW